MYQNTGLQNYLEQSSSINLQSVVLAEWNMNFSDNIDVMGNYTYKPSLYLTTTPTEANYGLIKTAWAAETDASSPKYYYGNTQSITSLVTGIQTQGTYNVAGATIYTDVINQTESMLYSLSETVSRFRPRSGINKLRNFGSNYMNYANPDMHEQPRFYLSSKDDKFKYWTSYRTVPASVSSTATGISFKSTGNGDYWINDTAPFVVYKTPVASNRLVIKMQTGVGDVNNGPYKKSNNTSFNDPFYEDPANTGNLVNQKTPTVWKIQYLDASTNNWTTAKSFTLNELRANGKRIIGSDGYVELAYGITNAPTTFRLLGEYVSQYALPLEAYSGDAYLVPDPTNATSGTIYVWNGTDWTTNSFVPTYGWYLNEEGLTTKSSVVTNLTSPDFYGTATTLYTPTYREFQFVKGIRIVVDAMSQNQTPFDLIEMSPRLVADLSDKAIGFSVEKIASDIGATGIAVGQLLASTGSLQLFDYDQSFNEYNDLTVSGGKVTGSLISNITSKNMQIKFYEHLIDDRNSASVNHYFVPIKTLYADGFPQISNKEREVSITLRDLLFYFESITAPSLLLKNVSLSFAIATLLDNIGFSNYKFYRNANESEDIIPYFFIPTDTSVAEVLNDLAQSTQTAMFFDEDNNFVTMSRNYIMPTVGERSTNITLYGTKDFASSGIQRNQATSTQLANIVSLDAEDNVVYNGGKVTYTNRYIQKSTSTIQEQSMLNKSRAYKYKPVLLWEVSGTESLRPENDEVSNQSAFSLSALALNSELSSTLPYYDSATSAIKYNTMDVGQSVYWLTRYKGYLYANSEIIKYDAVEYSVSGIGNVWISDIKDYQTYFSKLPFNGKIYPTGKIRIYAEPNYDSSGNPVQGTVTKHGRGQFGTTATTHTVLDKDNYWLQTDNHKSFQMQSKWIYNNNYQYNQTKYTISGVTGTSGSTTLNVSGGTAGLLAGLSLYDYSTKSLSTQTPTFASGKMTFTLNSHGYVPGNVVKISGATPATYNGDYTIFSTTTNTFTVLDRGIASGSMSGAKANISYTNLTTSSSFPSGTKIKAVASTTSLTLNKKLTGAISSAISLTFVDNLIEPLDYISYNTSTDIIPFMLEKPTVTGTTKDFFDSSSYTESTNTKTVENETPNGAIKSSAISIQGPDEYYATGINPNDVVSYVHKNYLEECPTAYSFGTRMRVVGKPFQNNDMINEAKQMPVGGEVLQTIKNSSGTYNISGTGGGIAINLDVSQNQNTGYFFEITALTNEAIIDKADANNTVENIPNVFFYKVLKGSTSKQAVPVVLWYGNAPILVDDGLFVGMSKAINTKNPTVYDLMVEVEDLGTSSTSSKELISYSKKFYLYLNGKLIATVQDDDAIPSNATNSNIGLFVRGKGLCMFEHVFAVGDRSVNPNSPANKKSVFVDDKIDNEDYRKYIVNPAVLSTYLKELGSSQQPKYSLYYEEFGTIMRECAYFNIRYDKAYPALYSKISPTFNNVQGYIVSNFRSNPYGAEFMVFNATDFALNLDESSGNYLRIQGVTFTQQSSHDLTVDEYFQKNSALNDYSNYSTLNNKYMDIQNSRNTYGKKDFTLTGNYIQNIDTANNLMDWMVSKVMVPKKSVGLEIFANPMIQLGDIVEIDYSIDNVLQNSTARFVVYHINYTRNSDGPTMNLYLSEVV